MQKHIYKKEDYQEDIENHIISIREIYYERFGLIEKVDLINLLFKTELKYAMGEFTLLEKLIIQEAIKTLWSQIFETELEAIMTNEGETTLGFDSQHN